MSQTYKRNRKKGIAALLSVVLVFSIFLTACGETNDSGTSADNDNIAASTVNTAQGPFSGGNGTTEDPYQVETAEQLDRVRDDLGASYILTSDIDLTGYENWTPIGEFQSKSDVLEDTEIPKAEVAFRGTFDGNGHKISNMTIDAPQSMAVGLFGCVTGGEDKGYIRNLTLENVNVNGAFLVGGAVGLQFMNFEVDGITLIGDNTLIGMQGIGGIVGTGFDWIRNCNATADITVFGDNGACAGIIAGGTTFSSIENCVVSGGTITADGESCWGLGGICGAPYAAAEIKNCEVTGITIRVSGTDGRLVGGIGGFAGTYGETPATNIEGCWVADVDITLSDSISCVGGIVGGPKEESEGSTVMSSLIVKDCVASGTITGGSAPIGSIIGDETNTVELNCSGEMNMQ